MMARGLPPGWIEAPVGELFDTETGSTPPKNDDRNYGDFIPLVKPPELRGGAITSAEDGLSRSGASKARVLPAESVLVSCIGNLGKTALNLVPVAFNQQINAILPRKELADPWFVLYQVQSMSFVRQIEALSSATTISIVNKSKFNSLPIRIAPRSQQSRIVSRIDELFSRIDEGERALERVQKLVERYRQSVLKAAVTGELTRDWREKNIDKLESGQALLARILQARREAWEKTELDKMKAKGITPADDKWKQKYAEPGDIVTDYLVDLPGEWQRVRIDAVGEVQLGRQRSPAHHDGEYMRPYLRVANVHQERIDISDLMSMNFTPEEFVTYSLRSGDILLNEGQSKELIGRPAMYGDEVPGACFTNTLVRFRSTSAVLAEFALIVFLHYMKSGDFQKIAKITTNIAHLGAGRFAEMSFPVPSVEEQHQIVDRVDRQSSVYSKLIAEVVGRRHHVSRLRQSVLMAAFSGTLVTQDPADESASALLERIASQLSDAPAESKRAPNTKTQQTA